MRLFLSVYFLVAVSAAAEAHTLTADESMPLQLSHQLLGLHHLPLTALLLIGGIVLLRQLRKSGKFYR
jgi:hypothetical protein